MTPIHEVREIRAAKAAGVTREQARKVLIAAGEPPSGGPVYVTRMAYLREAAESFGLNTWRMSDARLEKHLSRYPKCARLIRLAKEADAAALTTTKAGERDG